MNAPEPPDAIFLDHQSTTPVDPRVVEAIVDALERLFGNPASRTHVFGRQAREAVEAARAHVAALLGARPQEIVFTSGATEAANLALNGVARAYASRGRHLVVTGAEHRCVLDPARELEADGFEVSWVEPDGTGRVSVEAIEGALREDTILVAAIWANNEVGTLNPIRAIGAACHERGVLFFSDATQAVGKVAVDVEADGVDLLACSAHKLYGPKGAGALYVRRRSPRVRLVPSILGGGHERGLRSGTLNVPGIVGLGRAAELCAEHMAADSAHTLRLRERLEERLFEAGDVRLNGHPTERLPGCLNLSFRDVEAEEVMLALPQLALSSGSACSSAHPEPSHVLRAMGVEPGWIRGSLRFGVGRSTTAEEVERACDLVLEAVGRLRAQGQGAAP